MVAFISYLENHQVDIVTVKLTYSHFITFISKGSILRKTVTLALCL